MAGVKREEKTHRWSVMQPLHNNTLKHTTILIISPGILFLVNVLMVIISFRRVSPKHKDIEGLFSSRSAANAATIDRRKQVIPWSTAVLQCAAKMKYKRSTDEAILLHTNATSKTQAFNKVLVCAHLLIILNKKFLNGSLMISKVQFRNLLF